MNNDNQQRQDNRDGPDHCYCLNWILIIGVVLLSFYDIDNYGKFPSSYFGNETIAFQHRNKSRTFVSFNNTQASIDISNRHMYYDEHEFDWFIANTTMDILSFYDIKKLYRGMRKRTDMCGWDYDIQKNCKCLFGYIKYQHFSRSGKKAKINYIGVKKNCQ